jgi:nucleoside-diphosphate-sugar epimerase
VEIAVTGATGFLGRYLVRHLAGLGHRLRCWYGPNSDRGGFESVAASIAWQPGRLNDVTATASLVHGVEAVVHAGLAWPRPGAGPSRAQADFDAFVETNVMGSWRLFRAAHQANVPRLIFISSCAVHEVILDDRPLDESHPLWPTSHYGAHKAALEKFVHSFGLGQHWPICALRPTGIYGLAFPARQSRWFDLVGQVMAGQPVASPRGGKEVHAEDVARAVALLLTVDPELIAGQTFNCYDRYVSEQEVAGIAKEQCGSASPVADLNRGPRHQIVTDKLRGLGMSFGGEALLQRTVAQLIAAHV